MIPSRNQLILPLLTSASEAGGRVSTSDIYDSIAEKLKVPPEVRHEKVTIQERQGQYRINAFDRKVRWAQQTAKLMGLLVPDGKPYWKLTEKGQASLKEALPGIVITIFTTPKGVALFSSCEDAVAYIDDASVNLLFGSPPYPLIKPREYGNVSSEQYVSWFLHLAEKWPRIMAKDGSIVINLADVYEKGRPVISTYQEELLLRLKRELGVNLIGKFYWESPSKLPVPKTWVAVRRVRVKASVEQLYWLSFSEQPYADNRNVLRPYGRTMKRTLARGGENRDITTPSGHQLREKAFRRDNGGSIQGNLLIFPSVEKNRQYLQGCRSEGLPVHPARFPRELPDFFLRLLTREGDCVYDPTAGSLVTGEVAEALGRHWIASENKLEYILGGRHRFPHAVGPRGYISVASA